MATKNINSEKYHRKQASAVKPSPTPKPRGSSLLTHFWVQSFFLALLCFVFYANTFRNGYAVDDFLVIDNNEAISRGMAGIPQLLTSDVFDSYYRKYNANNRLSGGRYRPLALITYAVEQQAFGKTTTRTTSNTANNNLKLIYVRHVNNVLLYIISVIVLLYFLRKVVFPAYPLLAFLSVLLFAVHPIHTEVVANIKSRDEILSLLFITLTLTKAYQYLETQKIVDLLLALLCFFLALLSKEYAVSLIVIIPLMAYLFKQETVVRSLKTVLPFLGVFVLYIAMRYAVVPFTRLQEDDELLNNPYLLASGSQKIATEIATLLQYIKLLVFPHPLSVDYSYNQIPYTNITDLATWLSILFHAFLIAALVSLIKKRHALAFAIAFYLTNLLLVSNLLFPIGATMGERLIYHSSLGFSIAVAYLLYWWHQQLKPAHTAKVSLVAGVLLVVVLCAVKTIARNKDWESNSTLYRQDVLSAENSAITNANAGNAYLELASLQNETSAKSELLNKAMGYLNKAISIHPGYTLAYINRGNVFFQLGDLEHAKQDWDTAKQQYPTHPNLPGLYASYYINTAVNIFGSKGQYNEAIAALNKGAAIDPENTTVLFNLGFYYNAVGKKDSAIYAFQKIIDINPADTLAAKCVSYIDILRKTP
ncbi:MAG: tetratricopeptide repeat protein [Bacteroidetes bacterium]|nr:MAG: tetratricopeptide repeat protein [Bacteroidota bacterium]